MEHDMRTECHEKFKEIEERLKDGDRIFHEHDTELAVSETRIEHVEKSVNALVKASWGLAASLLIALVGFVLSKIN